jgi:antitoxin component YwqK of YwqJK toxin-antitoxin module
MERVFEHDKANGPATSWFENGQTSSTGSFLQNLPEGEWSQWYESGQLRSAGFYNKGKKQGRWNFFTETGEVDKDLTGVYVDDELVEPPPGK